MSSTIALVELQPSASLHVTSNRTSAEHQDGHSLRNAALTPAQASVLANPAAAVEPSAKLRGGKAVIVASQLSLSMLANSFATGLITIGIVNIAADLHLSPSLVYWPVLAYSLTSSPLLIPFGAIADVFGARPVNLAGCFGCAVFMMACGLARDGNELIAFRCLHGVASALSLPTAMSIVSTRLEGGKLRNLALASLGTSMIIGYALGLVLSGVFIDTIGWRFGYYLCACIQCTVFLVGLWTIPSTPKAVEGPSSLGLWQQLREHMDWVGAIISCACIGMVSYVLAMVAESLSSIKKPQNIILLVLSVLFGAFFKMWMSYRERIGKQALIPSSMWKKTTFTIICVISIFANAEMQCMELLASLFFQNVQMQSPLQSSLQILPGLISSIILNLVTGSIVHRLTISWTLAVASILAAVAPLLMAIINTGFPYWYEAFPAQIMYPFLIDVVFVVSAIVVADSFPERDQALAGAVFNTIANLGQSLGLAAIAVIINSVTVAHEGGADLDDSKHTPQGLMLGYRAGFWTAFASMILTAAIGAWGLRKADAVGIKRD